MGDLPSPVRAFLERLVLGSRAPAYLQVDAAGKVVVSGGDLRRYGVAPIVAGSVASDEIPLLSGMLPLAEDEVVLPWVKLGDGRSVDVHLLRGDGGDWVVLLDAAEDEARQLFAQQKTNELSLLRDRQARLLDQHVGAEVAGELLAGGWQASEQGERRDVTILFADLRGFTPYSEAATPTLVFRNLNAHLRVMIQPVVEESGWVDKIIGDAIMAVFGILDRTVSSADHAVRAGRKIVHGVAALGAAGALKPGVGIASGPVALGILGTRERRSFTAIGHRVNLAARLESQARGGELLIDDATHARLTESKEDFTPRTLTLKGLDGPVSAFSCEVLR